MILQFEDHEGDPVAVDADAIVGLSVSDVAGPRETALRVTLIWTTGTGEKPFMAAEPFEDVLTAWRKARLGEVTR